MPLVATGANLEYISRVTKLEQGQVTDALEQLVHRSLVDSEGTLNERRYTIHLSLIHI